MLKFFVLSAVLALASTYTVEDIVGADWRAVKVFSSYPVIRECEPLKLTNTNTYCTCGSDDKVLNVKQAVGTSHITKPVFFVDSYQGVTESFKTEECTCDGTKMGHYIFWRLSDNYFIMMFTQPGLEYAALVAKNIPSEAEVTEFVKNIEYFKDKPSYFVCTTETMNSNDSKVATGKKWWHYPTQA